MRLYRLGAGDTQGDWPFLADRHAYLADGTPLTEFDDNGRVVPAWRAFGSAEKICSGGELSLADRKSGLEALARALDRGDFVRAPILLLQLQIDEASHLAKYNHFHKPPGTGGGQFASGSSGDSDTHFAGAPFKNSDIEPVAQSMNVGFNSTYVPGIYGEDIDKAHALVMFTVRLAILRVGSLDLRPGMPGYGQALHDDVEALIDALHDPNLWANPVYVEGKFSAGGAIPAGASVPDIVYTSPSPGGLSVAWDIKTGRAVNTQDPGNVAQKERALKNMSPNTLYEYIQIYEK